MKALAVMAGCLAIFAGLLAGSAAAEPIGLVEEFDVGGSAIVLVPGPDGNVWFSFDRDFNSPGGGAIGRITSQGKVKMFGVGPASPGDIVAGPDALWFVDQQKLAPGIGRVALGVAPGGALITEFRAGLNPKSRPKSIVAGPDGNVWFTDAGKPAAIGRITPNGEITEFSAGLDPQSEPDAMAVGADGNLWFDNFSHSAGGAIGRITPEGTITEFGPGARSGAGTLIEPVLGADGNVWFGIDDSRTAGIGRITPQGAISGFSDGLTPGSSLLGPLVAGADGNLWFAARGQAPRTEGKLPAFGDATGIARIAPSGEIVEFSRCLHRGPPYTGPNSLVAGPDGNVWFTSTTTRSFPNVGTPPAIGRITPGGEITEFRAGLSYASTPDGIVVGPDGALWFADREIGAIGRLTPPDAPANTFLVNPAPRVGRGATTKLPVVAPGPGVFELEQIGLISARNRLTPLPRRRPIATAATAECGRAGLRLSLRGLARKRLRRYGFVTLKTKVTFIPSGGSRYSEYVPVGVALQRR